MNASTDDRDVQYWTQRIIDTLDGEGWRESSIEAVIRELLTKDTHYAAAETQMPSHEQCVEIFNNAWNKAMEKRCGQRVCDEAAVSAVRESCMRASAMSKEIRDIVLAPSTCGVKGHFRFQLNGGNCLMCQRERRLVSAAEAKVKQLEEQLAKLDALLVQSIEHNKGIIQSLDACQKFHEAIAASR